MYNKNAQTYNGKPCATCKRTEKYSSGWTCVYCAKKRSGVNRWTSENSLKILESRINRKKALETGEKTYLGQPCSKCNSREKFVNGSNCKNCNFYKNKKPRSKEMRDRYAKSPKGILSSRKNALKRLYGITIEEYEKMFKKQNSCCAICNWQCEGNLCIDHDHKTGKVRGLLCNTCNRYLGRIKDDPSKIQRYLEGNLWT